MVLIGLLVGTAFTIPTRADEAQESRFNFHVGGGVGVPLNPTAHFAGLSGTAQVGAGPNLSKHQSIVGEYMWQGLPPNRNAIMDSFCLGLGPTIHCPVSVTDNLFSLTANYMFHVEGERFGYYVIGGGGWYYRFAQFQTFSIGPGKVCSPAWEWWGYRCVNGFVSTTTAQNSKGVSSGGVNTGLGITLRLTQSGLKLYVEARYHYSPQGGRVSTQIVPVTFGIRW